ncbi:hypothetical protein E1301_Tti014327 [Triplophysa tibetana]|uniref:Uncharacterized protein n=1 Tax=Triplophysa tibetana TaxID=1572043 RepID=A0A5A9NGW1_9TELE|nr:hypothetical protein E1301_Tti014327 [Triplophysa tibetana]
MATNRERPLSHMTGFYPFAFNSMRNNSPFDLLANGSLFGRFGADLPKEMAALSHDASALDDEKTCVNPPDEPLTPVEKKRDAKMGRHTKEEARIDMND